MRWFIKETPQLQGPAVSSDAEIQPLASRGRIMPNAALNFLLLPLKIHCVGV